MNDLLVLLVFAALFVFFGLFFRKLKLGSCRGDDCETRQAGDCGCADSEGSEKRSSSE